MPNKIIKFNLLAFLFFGLLFLICPVNLRAESSDAIGIRITENPKHFSTLDWYQSQNFNGSPQVMQIDGYEAVRNGRTVYINVANIIDKDGDGLPDFLETNIFIISYNQEAQDNTFDIFGQLVKNLKFNTNISEAGFCSKTKDANCLNDGDCGLGEYCGSKKAKAIRDVNRLAGLANMKTNLDSYKQKNNSYPVIKAGTYLAGKTISTWPSWQQTLGQQLGANLPIDPLNKLGDCPGFDPITCWDQTNQKFATDLQQAILPAGSHAYLYLGSELGTTARYCVQMESTYKNLQAFNCFDDKKVNSQPVIKDFYLTAYPKGEFNGYVSISDLDDDPLKLSVELLSPSVNDWLANGWQWESGLNNFAVSSLSNKGQRKIYAPKVGKVQTAGYYKIRLTLDDGQGAANSIYSQIYNVTVSPFPATLERAEKTITIGSSAVLSMKGMDSNQDPINALFFSKATFGTSVLNQSTLANNGFIISGADLLENFKTPQHTGVYSVDVYAHNVNISTDQINSNFTYTIVNHPPVIEKLTATFSNKTTKICNSDEQCLVAIDNTEPAKVEIKGSDPDNHQLTYSLIDNFGGSLVIDSKSGLISGFEKLNYHQLTDQSFKISVKINDAYCANSSEAECSTEYSFDLLVKKYCSTTLPESMTQVTIPQTFTVNNSGETFYPNLNLTDCSIVATSSVDVRFVGKANSKAIVLVSDLSKSMDANITFGGSTSAAIDRLKSALTAKDVGFLDQVYSIVKNWPAQFSTKVGLVGYNKTVVREQILLNLALNGTLDNLKIIIGSYATDFQTNTLTALNKAEEILRPVTDPSVEKIIILMSDGVSGVDGFSTYINPQCVTNTCSCGGTWPDCTECCADLCDNSIPKTSPDCKGDAKCDPATQYRSCGKCYNYSCSCGGTYPDCNKRTVTCPPGEIETGCSDCYRPTQSVYNNHLDWRSFFSSLFKVPTAEAATTQDKCIYKTCTQAFPDFHCADNQYLNCSYSWGINCDLSDDVNAEATALKQSGVAIYTIYYNTGNTSVPEEQMCKWSSNNGLDCHNNANTFTGTDINTMINKVLGRIVTKPKDVKIGSYDIVDAEPTSLISSVEGSSVAGLSCGSAQPIVTYSNNGYLEFSNLKLNYCPAKLHP